MRIRKTVLTVAFAFVTALSAPAAQAAAILDFGTGLAGAGGTLSYSGGLAALVGQQVRIGSLTGFDTPQNAGTTTVTGNTASYGILNFTTGAYAGYWNQAYHWAGGGYFEILGNVLAAGVSGNDIGQSGLGGGALLLSGTFTGASLSSGGISLFQPVGFDQKNANLLSYFGLAADSLFSLSGYSVEVGGVPFTGGTPFTTTALGSTDIVNNQVPEPASLLLLGSGLTMLGHVIRRKRPLAGQ